MKRVVSKGDNRKHMYTYVYICIYVNIKELYMRIKQNPIKSLYLLLNRDSERMTSDAAKAGMLIEHLCSSVGKKETLYVSSVSIMDCFATHCHQIPIKTEQR